MDLSLHGSQINLATRHKPKPPNVKYPLPLRPGSANVSRSNRTSPFLRRPFSADQKLAKRIQNCIRFAEKIPNEEKSRKNKKYWSTSSSNILKLLLDEPIKRPWLCRNFDCSMNSLGRQCCDNSGCRNGKRDSFEDLTTELESRSTSASKEDQGIETVHDSKTSTRASTSKYTEPKPCNNSTDNSETNIMSYTNNSTSMLSTSKPPTPPTPSGDFWHDTKPDLPGRVSFGKSDPYAMDQLGGYENDHQYEFDLTASLANNKKSVHFKESIEHTSPPYEFAKCSTENCSCERNISPSPFTRQAEIDQPKCLCEFSCNSLDYTSLPMPGKPHDHGTESCFSEPSIVLEENDIIKQYKEALRTENSIVKHNNEDITRDDIKLQRDFDNKQLNNATNSTTSSQNSFFNNDLMEKFSPINNVDCKDSCKFESFAQNDSTHSRNITNNFSLSVEDDKVENILKQEQRHSVVSSNPVIKNYIDVSRTPIMTTGKKQNNSITSKRTKKSFKTRRSKSASASDIVKRNKTKLYKTGTYCCLREDSNLDEFQMDKIDSWMSLHKRSPDLHFQRTKPIKVYSPEEYEENETTDSPEPSKSEDVSQDSSTYEEIVSVIKEIDEDKNKGKSARAKFDMDLKLQALLQSDLPNNSAAVKETQKSPDKLKDILSYLEDVENSCDKTLLETRRSLPDSNRSEIEFTVEPDIAEDVPKLADLLMLPNHQLARRVVGLSLRANELANAIHLSKEHVTRIRLEKQKSLRLEKQSSGNRLREQKKHYETIVARHQGFIEQLLKDKASLCEKVTALTRRIESQNQAWEHKLETEVARVKDTTIAGEKIRRERWVRENTKKIKELTVKGLEAEINKMNSDHQQEITQLKRQHQQELLDAVDEARLKYEEMEKSVRESYAKEREATIEKERNTMRERFDRQLHDEQKAFDEQKSKLLEDLATERERLYADLKQKDNQFQGKMQELLQEKEIALGRAQSEYREKLDQQEQKYQNRINTIEKQYESDFLIWKREFENSCKLREVENENAIRQHYRTERDRQIDVIVSKMDSESQKNQEEFEMKLSRLKEKFETDIRESEAVEKSLRDKYNEARSKLAESDAQVQNLQADIKQLNLELDHSKKMCDEFLSEKEELKENLRNEVQQEIATIKVERDNEIQKIYKRVQQAIEKKDSTLEVLQKENTNLRERCIKLEAIIRQQRKDYCIK